MEDSKYNKEELEEMILVKKISYENIGKIYNCTGSNIKKVAKRLGINLIQRRKINSKETFNKGTGKKTYCKTCGKDISHKYGNIYCDTTCQWKDKQQKRYSYFLTEPKELQRANYNLSWLKPIILQEQNNKCAICNCSPIHNGKSLVFIIDHIDGDASHNVRSNLRLICPNCDSQLDTYKSKNKNRARSYYRYHKGE